MSKFTTELKVLALENGKWELIESFEYYIDKNNSLVIFIDAGFVTDFASVPRIFWNIFPPYSPKYGKAAVIHDALYSDKVFNRKKCDEIFKQAMKVLKASRITRNIIWLAVRIFGGFVWRNKTSNKHVHYLVV